MTAASLQPILLWGAAGQAIVLAEFALARPGVEARLDRRRRPPPVSIGRGAPVGAGSVVTPDVPPGVVSIGSPAKSTRKT